MTTNHATIYLLYRVGKSAMQSGITNKDLWALVPKNSKDVWLGEHIFNRQSQGIHHFLSKELAISHCQKNGFEYIEIPDTTTKKLRIKSYTNTINSIPD